MAIFPIISRIFFLAITLMPTSDFAKPWFIQGGIPPIVMI